jgi:magnesium-transporting ATPase (P-type)
VELAAFVAVLLELGWRPGHGPPTTPALLAASGAAFLAIVIGQAATALACRSSSRPVWRVPLRNNPLVLGALIVTWAIAAALVLLPGLARLLGHAPPTARGLACAALAFPIVLCADSLWKWKQRAA